jgi:hypothetical protein
VAVCRLPDPPARPPRGCATAPRHSERNLRRAARCRGHHVMASLLQDQQSSSRYVVPGIRSPYAAGRGRRIDASCCRSASARAFDGTSNRFAWSMDATWPPGSAGWRCPMLWSASFLRPRRSGAGSSCFPPRASAATPDLGALPVSPPRVCGAASRHRCRAPCRRDEAGHLPYVSTFVRDAPPRVPAMTSAPCRHFSGTRMSPRR